MAEIIMPEGYFSPLTIRETEVAIKEIKAASYTHLTLPTIA